MIILKNGYFPTPAHFQTVEDGLLQQTGGKRVLWSGRAATALYQAYHIAKSRRPDVSHPEVIVPAMMCATAANTALLSAIAPRFADVGAETGLMSLTTIQARYTENTIAVVVIHLLGHLVDLDPIKAWCEEKNLLLIEDPTQALGAQFPDGRYAGSVGDVTVYSFNATKIIPLGNGVLITNSESADEHLQKILTAPVDFPEVDDTTRLQLALSYRNLHHALVGLFRLRQISSAEISKAFRAVRPAYQNLFLRPANPEIDLHAAWENLPDTLQHRREMANIYAENLQDNDAWHLLTGFQQSGVCWRFSLLINDASQQVAFSEAVRRDGFHVSNLYWSASQFFNPADECPNADSFGRRIVNLWVDTSVDADYVQRCCASLIHHSVILAG